MANEDICVRFGRKLQRLRKSRGWNQYDLAAHTGIGRPHLSNLETGKKEAGLRTLEVLAKSFDMTLPQLLSRI
jgi:XRE family transcriptional regulator, regulator of sulfur utilization